MTGLFIPSPLPRTIAGFLASLLLTRSLRRWFKNRHLLHCREQYRGLLEHLLSRLSAGWTLERAFMDAPISLSRQVGEKTGLLISLHRIAAHLESKHPLDNLLSDLEAGLPLPEARAAFRILPILNRTGSDTYRFLQSNHRLTSRQLILQNELDADHAQRRTEAIILSLMPFAMAIFLRQSEQFAKGNADTAQILQPGLIVAWILSVLAAILVINTLSSNYASISRKAHRLSAEKKQHQNPTDRALLKVYRRLIPKRVSATLFQPSKSILFNGTKRGSLTQQYFKTKNLYGHRFSARLRCYAFPPEMGSAGRIIAGGLRHHSRSAIIIQSQATCIGGSICLSDFFEHRFVFAPCRTIPPSSHGHSH